MKIIYLRNHPQNTQKAVFLLILRILRISRIEK